MVQEETGIRYRLQDKKNKLKLFEKQLHDKEETLDKKLDGVSKKEKNMERMEKSLNQKHNVIRKKKSKLDTLYTNRT